MRIWSNLKKSVSRKSILASQNTKKTSFKNSLCFLSNNRYLWSRMTQNSFDPRKFNFRNYTMCHSRNLLGTLYEIISKHFKKWGGGSLFCVCVCQGGGQQLHIHFFFEPKCHELYQKILSQLTHSLYF